MKNIMLIPAVFSLTLICACGKQPVQEPADSAVPSAAPETAEPVSAEPEAAEPDFSLLYGTWHTESNMREITVYDNGGFALKDGTVLSEGYLSEDPEAPGKFALYLENNTRWGTHALLFADPDHPGTLTLQEGMGAELLVPGERIVVDGSEPLFELTLLDEVPEVGRVYHLEQTDTPAVFTVKATDRLENFRILWLDYEGMSSDGKPGFVTSELFYQEEMIPNEEITFVADINGTIPNIGITYDDGIGGGYYWYLTISGYDGSLEATPFWD